MYDFIQNNFVAIAIALFLSLFIITNNNFEKKTNRLFISAVFCVLVLIFEEAWEAQLAMNTVYTSPRITLSAIGYTLRPMIAYFLVNIFKNYNKAENIWLTAPLVINGLVAFSSLFCGISFGYTPDNEFVRGPLGYTPFVVSGFYIAILLVLTLKQYKNSNSKEAMIISAIVLLAFTSTVLESIFHFQFIQNPSIATSITFYYLFLHSNRNNRDPLTGALTRRRFYFDAQSFASSLSAVISLDINYLKELNDKRGHVAGDKALITIADTIKNHTSARVSFYRIGGDEFMILCYKKSEDEIKQLIGKIRADVKKTGYSCAIGYAMCPRAGKFDFDCVCQSADHMMYDDKRRIKSSEPLPAALQAKMPQIQNA